MFDLPVVSIVYVKISIGKNIKNHQLANNTKRLFLELNTPIHVK